MNKDPKVSNIQIRGLIVSTVIGVGVLSLPNTLTMTMGNKGWVTIILAGILIIPILYIINYIFKINPGKDFFQIGEETFGKIIFKIILIIMMAYFIDFCAYVVRSLGELVEAFLLPTTPIEVIVLSFILATSYLATHEIDVITRGGYFLYPIILLFAGIVILISIPEADFSNLLPLNNIDYSQIPRGLLDSFVSFAGFEMILFALPYVENGKDSTFKSSVYAMAMITAIYVLMYVVCIAHFSVEQLGRQLFPVLQLVKQVDLPGFFLENLDGLVMALWVLVVASTFIPAYFAAGKVISKIFNLKSHKYIILILIPIIYFLALYPRDILQINKILLKPFNILGLMTGVILPLLFLIVILIKKKVKK